ncbi:MAG TPA: DUF1501 domain-containing protein [Candidatus Binatia bacterium]|nr:DUF1501 domain-containing protein [Candidatus Binatia bacterium]
MSSNGISRRNFLKAGAGLGALAAMGAPGRAFATAAGDYKALVCIYMAGGNDGNNLIIPLDAARYGAYQAARSALAIPQGKLAPTSFMHGSMPYALHYGLPKLHARYLQGRVAMVLNVGNLIEPLTRAEYVSKLKPAPQQLFSHSDQTMQIQMGVPREDGTGWGGRLLDCVSAGNKSLGGISTSSSPAPFVVSSIDSGNTIPGGTDLNLAGLNLWPASAGLTRRQAIVGLLSSDGGSPLRAAANRAFADGLQLAADLAAASSATPLKTVFPGTSIGKQLQQIAGLVQLRAAQGPGRQVFIASLGSFDTHSGQDWQQWNLFTQIDDAVDAFHKAMELDLKLADKVTTISLSEFGRTLQSNGVGSDHGWGSHHFVVGGAVQGGLYGQLPGFALGGADDATNRGVWIPKRSTEQLGYTLGRWFGASDDELVWAFPSVAKFATADLGFMG